MNETNENYARATNQAWELKRQLKEANGEVERLKARDEFLTGREKSPAEPTGVLDSELI